MKKILLFLFLFPIFAFADIKFSALTVLGVLTNATDNKIVIIVPGPTGGSFSNVTITAQAFSNFIRQVTSDGVIGPSSATDKSITRYNLATGKLVQNSGVTLADDNSIWGLNNQTNSGLIVSSNGYTSVGTNNGAIRLSGTNTGFAEHTVFKDGPSNSFVWSLQGAPTVGQALAIHAVNVQAGTNQIVITNAAGGGNTFNANQFDSSGTIDLLSGALATNLVHFGTFTFNSAVGLDITATNFSKFGSIDVRTNINANTVTVTNTFTGLGTGNNGIDNLTISNNATIRTNVAAIDIATNELVLNTYYTNTARRAFVGVSVQLTAAAAGTAKVSLRAEYTGTITNIISVSAGPLASLVTVEPLLMLIGPSCRYYVTNETSGTGASVSVVNGTSTVSGL